jgi:ribose 1,5-bisphosphate isomerase
MRDGGLPLPERAAALRRDFESPEMLGASRQLAIAAQLLLALAEDFEGDDEGLLAAARAVAAELAVERGGSSQAFPNALGLMVGVDPGVLEAPGGARRALADRVREVDDRLRADMARLVEHGAALLVGCRRVLVYDYSSSVAAILATSLRQEAPPLVVVAEARPLDGGRKYLGELSLVTHGVEFVPDAAVPALIESCDVALFGAETISAQGDCYNTAGSLAVALAGRHFGVPVWVATTLVKIDLGTLRGHRRKIPPLPRRHLGRIAAELGLGEDVPLACPDLDLVPADLLSGFVTEVGVLPPAAVTGEAIALAKRIGDA